MLQCSYFISHKINTHHRYFCCSTLQCKFL